jgi:hypothetical protein
MLHQAEKERQFAAGDALLIEREDEMAGFGVEQVIGILHALGDALEGQQRAKVIGGEKRAQLLLANIGIDGHRSLPAASS